jgi:hypothetical protein
MKGMILYDSVGQRPDRESLLCNAVKLLFVSDLDRMVDRDSAVGVATWYGLYGPGFIFRRNKVFQHLSRLSPRNFQWVIRPERGASVEKKKED